MAFVELINLTDQTLMITGRSAGQQLRFNGSTVSLPVDGATIRVYGTGPVELGPGYWGNALVTDDLYTGSFFDGDSGEGEMTRYVWTGTPRASTSEMQQRHEIVREQNDEEYAAVIDPLRRYLHNVGTLSGAVVSQEFNRGDAYGQIVEFTLGAEDPGVYGLTKDIELQPTTPFLVQDEAYNLVTTPSAELAGATVVVATNYSQNPSVEVNSTGWGYYSSFVVGRAAFTDGRTTELAAEGTASYRLRLLANGTAPTLTTLAANPYIEHTVDLTGVPLSRFEVSIWGAIIIAAGQATISQVNASVNFYNASDAQVGGTSSLGGDIPSSGYSGYNFKGGVFPPDLPGIVKAKIRIYFSFVYTVSADPALNADVRMYGDAAVFAIL